MKLGRAREALADLSRALAADAADAEALVWRSEAHRLAGRPAAALADADAALAANPDTPWALIARFLALRAKGREDEEARALVPLHGLLLELMPGVLEERGCERALTPAAAGRLAAEAQAALDCLAQAAAGDRARLPPPMLEAAAALYAQRRRRTAAASR